MADGIKISGLPQATGITDTDVVAGVQNSATKKIPLTVILDWIRTRLTPASIGAQPTITASGMLKGDGSGGVSAAVAGTDYQAPLTAGTDYATPAMIPSVPSASDASPQMDGTAAAGSSDDYARADHAHPSDTSKQDVLTFDSTPTANSSNPVTSGGIEAAIANRDATATTLYNTATNVGTDTTITLTDAYAGYSYLAILASAPGSNYAKRTTMIVPVRMLGFNSYFLFANADASGVVRITSVSGQPKQLAFSGSTVTDMTVISIFGIK